MFSVLSCVDKKKRGLRTQNLSQDEHTMVCSVIDFCWRGVFAKFMFEFGCDLWMIVSNRDTKAPC